MTQSMCKDQTRIVEAPESNTPLNLHKQSCQPKRKLHLRFDIIHLCIISVSNQGMLFLVDNRKWWLYISLLDT